MVFCCKGILETFLTLQKLYCVIVIYENTFIKYLGNEAEPRINHINTSTLEKTKLFSQKIH